jgi:hypothetical protein
MSKEKFFIKKKKVRRNSWGVCVNEILDIEAR